MSPPPVSRETASEIARRYGLEDLVRARGFSRRYYINSLASKAYSLIYDMQPGEDLEYRSTSPRYLRYGAYRRPYYLRDLPVLPRRNLQTVASRMLYDRRLAEQASARRDTLKRMEIASRYYMDDPLAILDMSDEDLDDIIEDENVNEVGGHDKNDGPTAAEKGPDNASSPANERTPEQPPALSIPESRYLRRSRCPRLSSEAIYRILDAGI